MDLSNLSFGQLLHLLDSDDLKNKIRNYEKQKKQIISAKYGIIFNQTCLNEGLYPTFTNIYICIYILGWPLGIGNFQKLKIMLLPPPYLVPIINKTNYAIF